MTVTREVSWGDALVVAAFHAGGIKAAVERIHAQIGSTVGSRNTFAKLLKEGGPDGLGARDLWRAWLLIAALGEEPSDWRVSDEHVPAAFDAEALKQALCPGRESNSRPFAYKVPLSSLSAAA